MIHMSAIRGRSRVRLVMSDEHPNVLVQGDVDPRIRAKANLAADAAGISVGAYLEALVDRDTIDEQGRPVWLRRTHPTLFQAASAPSTTANHARRKGLTRKRLIPSPGAVTVGLQARVIPSVAAKARQVSSCAGIALADYIEAIIHHDLVDAHGCPVWLQSRAKTTEVLRSA